MDNGLLLYGSVAVAGIAGTLLGYVRSALSAQYASDGYSCQSCLWTAEQGQVYIFPDPVRAREFGLARQVRSFRLASTCSFSTLRLNLVLNHGNPAFRDGVQVYRQSPSGQLRVYRVTESRTDSIHCRQSAAFQVLPWNNFYMHLCLPTPTIGM